LDAKGKEVFQHGSRVRSDRRIARIRDINTDRNAGHATPPRPPDAARTRT